MSSSTSPGLTEALPPVTWLEGPHGRLACTLYPAAQPWLRVLVSHGFAEHSGWWHHVATALQARGASACLFDHYHHGRSAGAPGDVEDYAHLVGGLRTALEQGAGRLGAAPLVLLAHSNGALVALLALEGLAPGAVQGLVLGSPFLEMRPRAAWGGVLLASLLRLVSLRLRVQLQIRPWRLTSDEAIWPQYAADPLRFHSITVRFFLAMRRALRAVRRVRDVGGRPLLVLRAGQEQVVSGAAIDAFCERVQTPDKTRRLFPDLRHELFNERVWESVLEEVLGWCHVRFATQPGGEA
jgi:acylglycerol lipase